MKSINNSIKFIVALLLCTVVTNMHAQVFKKLGKKAQKASERTVERRVEKESSKKTDEVLDKVFEEDEEKNKKDKSKKNTDNTSAEKENPTGKAGSSVSSSAQDPELNYKGKMIFQDDFQTTATGSFPGKFTSSSGGEVVTLGSGKGLKFYPNSNVLLNLDHLPDNFAFEFDLTLENVPPSLYNTFFNVYFQELNVLKYNDPKNKFGAIGFNLWGDAKEHQIDVFNKKAAFEIAEKIPYDINSNIISKTSRFVILVNENRLRLFINGKKIADSPNLLQGVDVKHINFRLNGTKKEKNQHFIISNLKVTAISEDLRSQLIGKGTFTTNNILFASGSDKIQASSYSLLDDIADAIKESGGAFQIIGHTDSDGEASANLSLSKKRAESVRTYLISKGVSAGNLKTEGKGESEPAASNNSEEGKAQNRRVEFKKI